MPPKKDLLQKETEPEETSLDLYNQGLIRAQPGQAISFSGNCVRYLSENDFAPPNVFNQPFNTNHIDDKNYTKHRYNDEERTTRYLIPVYVPRPHLNNSLDFNVQIKYAILFENYCTFRNDIPDTYFVVYGDLYIPMRHEYYNYLYDPNMFNQDDQTGMYRLFTDPKTFRSNNDQYVHDNYEVTKEYKLLSDAYYMVLQNVVQLIANVIREFYKHPKFPEDDQRTNMIDLTSTFNFTDKLPNDIVMSELDVYNGNIRPYEEFDIDNKKQFEEFDLEKMLD